MGFYTERCVAEDDRNKASLSSPLTMFHCTVLTENSIVLVFDNAPVIFLCAEVPSFNGTFKATIVCFVERCTIGCLKNGNSVVFVSSTRCTVKDLVEIREMRVFRPFAAPYSKTRNVTVFHHMVYPSLAQIELISESFAVNPSRAICVGLREYKAYFKSCLLCPCGGIRYILWLKVCICSP